MSSGLHQDDGELSGGDSGSNSSGNHPKRKHPRDIGHDDGSLSAAKRRRRTGSAEAGGSSTAQGACSPLSRLTERQQLNLLRKQAAEEGWRSAAESGGSVSPTPATPFTTQAATERISRNGETRLHDCAKRGNIKETRQLIQAGADVNVKDYAGWTPLHEACNQGWYEVAEALLQAGATVNEQGYLKFTPLHDAASNGHTKVVELLLKHGANPVQQNTRGKTPLDVALSDHIRDLLKREIISASPSVSDESPRSPSPPVGASPPPAASPQPIREENRSPPASPPALYISTAQESEQSSGGEPTSPAATAALDIAKECKPLYSSTSFKLSKSDTSATDAYESKKSLLFEDISDEEISSAPSAKLDWAAAAGMDRPRRRSPEHKSKTSETPSKDVYDFNDGDDSPPHAIVPRSITETPEKKRQTPEAKEKPKDSGLKPAEPTDDSSGTEGRADLSDDGKQKVVPPLRIVIPSHMRDDPEPKPTVSQPYVRAHEEGQVAGSEGVDTALPQPQAVGLLSTDQTDQDSVKSNRSSRSAHARSSSKDDSAPSQRLTRSQLAQRRNKEKPTEEECSDVPVQATGNTTGDNTTAGSTSVENAEPGADESQPVVRRLRPRPDASAPVQPPVTTSQSQSSSNTDASPVPPPTPEVFKMTKPPNGFELYLSKRSEVKARQASRHNVMPSNPPGYSEYLSVSRKYLLADSNTEMPSMKVPNSVEAQMKSVFGRHENERHKMRVQHRVQREKLILSMEQETMRVYTRVARTAAGSHLPASVCLYLKEMDVLKAMDADQLEEAQEKSLRSRKNQRQFHSWIHDITVKYERLKESLVHRQLQEADTLLHTQRMEWSWKLQELQQDRGARFVSGDFISNIPEAHVPMVAVVSNFSLLPPTSSAL